VGNDTLTGLKRLSDDIPHNGRAYKASHARDGIEILDLTKD